MRGALLHGSAVDDERILVDHVFHNAAEKSKRRAGEIKEIASRQTGMSDERRERLSENHASNSGGLVASRRASGAPARRRPPDSRSLDSAERAEDRFLPDAPGWPVCRDLRIVLSP